MTEPRRPETHVVWARNPRVLWREEGRCIVAIALDAEHRTPALLRGGGALVWRTLDKPLELGELLMRVREDDSTTEAEVGSATRELQAFGLLMRTHEDG